MYVEKTVEAAEAKYALYTRNVWLFILKSFLGGVFIVFGAIAAYSAAVALYPISPGLASMGVALTFPLALLTIVFLGGELFTSGVFVMGIGFMDKKFSVSKVLKIWGICYIGNFVSIVFFLSLYCLTKSYPSGLPAFVELSVAPKLQYSAAQLIFKGIFCNFAVCCAYYASIKMTTDVGKYLMIFIIIFSFVISGFEHCIANMAYFTMGFFLMEDFSVALAFKNLFFSTIGNIIGGAILLGVPVYLLEAVKPKKAL